MNISIPSGWRLVKLIDLVDIDRGGIRRGPFGGAIKKEIFIESGYKVYEQKNAIYNDFNIGSYFIDDEKYKELQSFAVKPDDLIVSCSGTLGRIAIVPSTANPGIINQALMRITPKKNVVSPTFLKILLETPQSQHQLFGFASGSAIKNVKPLTEIKASNVALPPIEEQSRIVGILARADRLRQMRRYALQLSDGYLHSVFLQMFGDPVTNPMGWETGQVGDIIKLSQYGTSDKSNSEQRGYPVLGMGNLTYSGHLELFDLSYVDLTKKEFQKLKLEKGDVIFNRTNSTELVGKTAHWNVDMEAVLASYLVKLKLKSNVLPDYFVALLNSLITKCCFNNVVKKAVGQSNVSPTLLKEFPMLIPSYNLQKKYSQIGQQVERLRSQQREAARQADHLFATLLHRAFRGEL